ncbi:membrane lipoprotein lipid attachment site-containing protein [Heyndrickxia sporothermodurans]|uniref:Uncharacterized protein n=1 Tax=Heyndrickxia sporothermodurans TaxID=46224 RepID=A0A150L1F2_9BACI|nr:membrane lipoprotein lipid attachment site-containing protein [Heyndrickxia sporothermodurans]KYD05512.1 hypothetical protein B4102_3236 [Heyndrickxia sporothermodurans]MBL5768301.1 membrane lipoprotein lipid attachment site-containing protein [Heyndrickxia sporothermodurans]MBL5772534.1 membrane lipoprotein lipid attachment site-containing protein [Heyndrickxia sporothermodurans]MBL5776035.1 membrane lipoprotein lipid attachment site-containing protein [Heyndrickxia sporothermodurans]MBL57
MKKAIFLLCSIILLTGCSDVKHNNKVESSFSQVIKKGGSHEIDLNSLTDFTWDKAFIFPPYTVQESINEQLGTKFKDPSNIDRRDDIYLLVFLQKSKVVQYAEINRQHLDFSLDKEYLTPEDATVKIVKR